MLSPTQVPDKDLDDEPAQDQKKISSEQSSPIFSAASFPTQAPGEVEEEEWQSEDDTLYAKPHSRRLSAYEPGLVAGLSVPVDPDNSASTPAVASNSGTSEDRS